jgi:hypothetical protein
VGVQIGSLRSPFGVLGSWATVEHDEVDLIGACSILLSAILRSRLAYSLLLF